MLNMTIKNLREGSINLFINNIYSLVCSSDDFFVSLHYVKHFLSLYEIKYTFYVSLTIFLMKHINSNASVDMIYMIDCGIYYFSRHYTRCEIYYSFFSVELVYVLNWPLWTFLIFIMTVVVENNANRREWNCNIYCRRLFTTCRY